MVNQKT